MITAFILFLAIFLRSITIVVHPDEAARTTQVDKLLGGDRATRQKRAELNDKAL